MHNVVTKYAIEDYMEELWAEKVVENLASQKGKKSVTLEQADTALDFGKSKPAKSRQR